MAIKQLILDSNSDIICLQEFWFDDAGKFQKFFEEKLSANYSFHYRPRTNSWKGESYKWDGIAIMVKKPTVGGPKDLKLRVVDEFPILFSDKGNRVGKCDIFFKIFTISAIGPNQFIRFIIKIGIKYSRGKTFLAPKHPFNISSS